MSLPRYPNYKDSGVEWLGEVPGHWYVISIKWLSPVRRGASPRPIDDPKYFDDDGEFSWVRIADVSACDGVLNETTQRLSELGSSLSVKMAPGELFVSIAGTVGKPCISAIKACIHDGFVYFPTLQINPRFLYRVFEGGTCYGGLGKWGTQLNLNTDTIGSIRVALPPPDELKRVLEFLDRETAKIDELVAEQRRLMALLKEKRQAVISHAVTRGLNPDAPLKPSGIEWLGDVPAHWEVLSLRRCCTSVQTGGTPSSEPPSSDTEQGCVWFAPGDFNDSLHLTNSARKVSTKVVSTGEVKVFPPGSVLIVSIGATLGKVGFASESSSANQQINAVIPSEKVDGYFLAYSLLVKSEVMRFLSNASTIGIMNQEKTKDIWIAVPPRTEQSQISDFLDTTLAKLDTLTTEAQRAIDLLQERRTALISAAVTGQIDVREDYKSLHAS